MASIFDDAQSELNRLDKLESADDFDYSKITNVELGGIDTNDYPDFCDAYIVSAKYDGREMTDDEIEELNENTDFVYEQVIKKLY